MSTETRRTKASPFTREMLNKVPEITLCFWVIKILATTVGETAADYLNVNLKLGLTTRTDQTPVEAERAAAQQPSSVV
jgi:uncharacterized membrane-anchored protein